MQGCASQPTYKLLVLQPDASSELLGTTKQIRYTGLFVPVTFVVETPAQLSGIPKCSRAGSKWSWGHVLGKMFRRPCSRGWSEILLPRLPSAMAQQVSKRAEETHEQNSVLIHFY